MARDAISRAMTATQIQLLPEKNLSFFAFTGVIDDAAGDGQGGWWGCSRHGARHQEQHFLRARVQGDVPSPAAVLRPGQAACVSMLRRKRHLPRNSILSPAKWMAPTY